MPWRPMNLRGTRVLVRAKDTGEPLARGARVEIRYREGDSKSYNAAIANLEIIPGAELLPDDACAPSSAKGGAGAKKGPAGGPPRKHAAPPATVPDGAIVCYADGACSGNPGPCGLGVVRIIGDERDELFEFLGHGTNNIAELMAIRRAVESIEDRAAPVRVFTDSGYSIGVLQRGWKAKANHELIAETKAAISRIPDVLLVHVPGHAGIPLNERADELARAAVETRANSGWKRIE